MQATPGRTEKGGKEARRKVELKLCVGKHSNSWGRFLTDFESTEKPQRLCHDAKSRDRKVT